MSIMTPLSCVRFWGFLLTASVAAAEPPASRDESPPASERACMLRDVEVTTRIEDEGARAILSSEALAHASFLQIEARVLCRRGEWEVGFLLYQRALKALDPTSHDGNRSN